MTNNFLLKNEIRSFQIDHNSTCNLRCPQCARIVKGKVNELLPKKILNLDFYKKVFEVDFCQQLHSVLFCGNYGDVVVSENILDVCSYLRESGVKKLGIMTNGSMRPTSWWENLAKIFHNPRDRVCFSIDGLEDTNHLYRVGSDFEKIIENAEAFIKAGGKARWDYLVFAHNEHQVEQARALALKIGFSEFNVKITNRFIEDKQFKSGKKETKTKVRGKSSKEYNIEQPEREKYQSSSLNRFEGIIKKHGSWDDYIKKTEINCKTRAKNSMFIDFEGNLWPCTWLAAPKFFHGGDNRQKDQILKLLGEFGEDFNNLHKKSIDEVLNHPWFREKLVSSWSSDVSGGGKLMTCGRTCGKEYEFSSDADENKRVYKLS